ncbi:hypothetical protein HO173_005014 [Letharia columbiana]|uniref:Conidiation-specific protein 6 n=1 Tax=Letharia columbiana TaxID=112416 RepID=A0A8H6L5T6_9LECA|nr:uncharacterized protein HO173_005014 [Letharia columbiana]KAF6236723.1 hypothetical protein HO173_005014 [Letharia columbiana]
MADEIHDSTAAGTAKENIPTMSNPMDNIHGNVEDISNKASGYKAAISNPNTKPSTKENAKEMLEKLGGEDAFMKNNGKGE